VKVKRKEVVRKPSAPESESARDESVEQVIPVIEEEIDVSKRKVDTGVTRITKRVYQREEVIDEPLLKEEVHVERVAVNRYIEEPVAIRREKEKTIIPVLEEVLVVEKRLLLKEELHVSKRTTEVRNPQEAVVRSEEVEIENMAVAGQSKKKTEQ
jgi:uncharacterized protein (TIGR02271 family)